MSENETSLIDKLKEINNIDSQYAIALAEKTNLDKQISEKEENLKVLLKKAEKAVGEYSEKQRLYTKEEQYLKAEQEKIVERRKALRSLADFKLQEKAEREVTQASKQISVMEENLILQLDSIEELSKVSELAKQEAITLKESLDKLKEESVEHYKTLEERMSGYEKESLELKSGLDPKSISQYDRVVSRYAGEALAKIDGVSCTGCYCSLGPQILVKVSRANDLIMCQSCGRILYLEKEEAAAS